jgi:hypothetical protein
MEDKRNDAKKLVLAHAHLTRRVDGRLQDQVLLAPTHACGKHWTSGVVHLPAVVANIAAAPGERADAAHPQHGVREVPPERFGVGGIKPHERVGDAEPAGGEQLLVRVQHAPAPQQGGVVQVVEAGGGGVERREVVVAGAGARRARGPERRGEGPVQRLVVCAVAEVDAPGEAQRVAARERDQVGDGEPVRCEVGDEAVQVEGRRRDAVVRRRLARHPRVPPAQRHVVRRPAQLLASRN